MVVMKSMTRLALVAASSLPVFCVPVFSAASGADVSESNWGNVMFVGDSITHGVNSASWRWEMHKILVDNGVSYNGIGYKTGHHSGGVSNGELYGGVSFSNPFLSLGILSKFQKLKTFDDFTAQGPSPITRR